MISYKVEPRAKGTRWAVVRTDEKGEDWVVFVYSDEPTAILVNAALSLGVKSEV